MTTCRIDAARPPPQRPRRPFARAALLLAVASVLAVAGSAAMVALVSRAEFLTGSAVLVTRFIFAHGVLAALAAASPIFAALLVGYGYMQRGLRKRAAERRLAASLSRSA